MTNCLGIECDKMVSGSYQASMFDDKDGFTLQPIRHTISICRKLGYYPDPGDCRMCKKAQTIVEYTKLMTN